MTRSISALLLTLALLAAGCLGATEEPTTPASADDPAGAPPADAPPAEADPTTPSPSSAPADEAPPATTETAAENGTASASEPVDVPLAFEGSFPTFAQPCAGTVVTGGVCYGVGTSDVRNRFEIDADGQATALRLTMTWTASSPVTEGLSIAFYSFTDDDFVQHGRVYGTSPLVLELDEPFTLEEGWTHMIGVGASYYGVGTPVGGAGAYVGTDQPFTLEGALTLAG